VSPSSSRAAVRPLVAGAHYDLGRGLRAFAGRDEQRLKAMVALTNRKLGDLSAMPKDPATAFALLDRLVRSNIMAAEADRISVAVIMDQASYVFPSGDPGRLSLQSSSELVTMLNWAMSPHVKAAEHGVRARRREARRPERSPGGQPPRRDDRGAAAGRAGPHGVHRGVDADDRHRHLLGLRRRRPRQAHGRHRAAPISTC
jgi:hypothetical protein